MNAHPWSKPFVRLALMPAVGVSLFLTRSSSPAIMLALLCLILMTVYGIARTVRVRGGGLR